MGDLVEISRWDTENFDRNLGRLELRERERERERKQNTKSNPPKKNLIKTKKYMSKSKN